MMPVDDSLKAIVNSLTIHKMMNNTVLVVHSDNGGDTCHAAGDAAPWGSNWPLRGRKMGYFEGGIKVPAFLYSPRLLESVLCQSASAPLLRCAARALGRRPLPMLRGG